MAAYPKNPNRYRYVILLACMLLSACSTGMLVFFGALYVVPVTTALGVPRAAFALTTTVGTIVSILVLPTAGKLFQRIPIKRLLMAGVLLGATGQFIYSFANSMPVFYVGGLFSGVANCLFGVMPINIIISRWFTEKRGTFTGIAFTGSGLASALLSPYVSRLIATNGWRFTYRLVGITILVIVSFVVFFLIKDRPEETAPAANDADTQPAPLILTGFTRKEALSLPSFWIYGFAVFLIGLVAMATQQQLVAFWTDVGNTPEFAAQIFSVMFLVSITSKVLMGFIYDRISMRASSILFLIISCLAFVSLLLFKNGAVILIPAIFFGMQTANQVIIPPLMTLGLFGTRDYSSIYGIVMTLTSLGTALGIPLCAGIFDGTGSYLPAWVLFAACSLLSLVLLLVAQGMVKKREQQAGAVQVDEKTSA